MDLLPPFLLLLLLPMFYLFSSLLNYFASDRYIPLVRPPTRRGKKNPQRSFSSPEIRKSLTYSHPHHVFRVLPVCFLFFVFGLEKKEKKRKKKNSRGVYRSTNELFWVSPSLLLHPTSFYYISSISCWLELQTHDEQKQQLQRGGSLIVFYWMSCD